MPSGRGGSGQACGPRGPGGMCRELSMFDFPSDSPDAGHAGAKFLKAKPHLKFSEVKPRFRLWLQGPWNPAIPGPGRRAISRLRFEESWNSEAGPRLGEEQTRPDFTPHAQAPGAAWLPAHPYLNELGWGPRRRRLLLGGGRGTARSHGCLSLLFPTEAILLWLCLHNRWREGEREATCQILGFIIFFCLHDPTQIVWLTYF